MVQYEPWEGWSLGTPQAPDRTPLLDLLRDYIRKGVVPYHTPAHKQGRAAPPRLVDALGPRPFLIDLDGELGEPGFAPSSADAARGRERPRPAGAREALEAAEQLAALAHGADHARFLVNGTTAGLHALLLAATGPGRPVILPRNVHRSVIGGLILSGARPRFVRPEFLDEAGVFAVPTPAALQEAVRQEPDAAAIVLTAPTYYGWLPDVAGAARVARAARVPLWVDEAHGSLLGFHPRLPRGALASGADAAVRSLHKGAGALVQASLLLVGAGGPEMGRLDAALGMLQSSSPSPLLLASLDAARAWLVSDARPRLERLVEEAERLRQELGRIPGVRCWGGEVVGKAGIAGYDPTRIVFSVAGLGLTGFEAAAWLRREERLQVEMADLVQVVVVLSAADGRTSTDRILGAVRRLAGEAGRASAPVHLPPPVTVPPAVLTPREAFLAPARVVTVAEASGEIVAETVAPYPPGIPLLVPGERITRESLEVLRHLRLAGARIQGAADPTGATLRVVDGSPGAPGRRRRREGG